MNNSNHYEERNFYGATLTLHLLGVRFTSFVAFATPILATVLEEGRKDTHIWTAQDSIGYSFFISFKLAQPTMVE